MAFEPFLNSVGIGILVSILAIVAPLIVAYAAKKRSDLVKMQDRIVELEKSVSLVNQAVIPISAAFQAILIKDLTHFHTPEMDVLMQKIGPPFLLTEAEAARLTILLQEREKDMSAEISEQERDAARMLPLVMKRVLADKLTSGLESELLVRVVVMEQKDFYPR